MRPETRQLLSKNAASRDKALSEFIAKPHQDKALIAGLAAHALDLGYGENTTICPIWFAYVDPKLVNVLKDADRRLIEVTDFYYHGVDWSLIGDRPFEKFILNETFNKLGWGGSNYTRSMLLDDICACGPYLRELIIDTCNFVLRGRREINIVMLRQLAVDYALSTARESRSIPDMCVQRNFQWSEIENMSSQEFFTRWVSQKGGLQDLIEAHRIMLSC